MKAYALKVKINPTNKHCNVKVQRNLYCRILVIADNETTIVIVSCDLLLFGRKWTDKICKKISHETSIPSSNILICCTHNHNALFSFEAFLGDDENYDYLNKIVEPAIITGVQEAVGNFVNASIAIGSGQFNLYVDNSRFLLKDQTIAWCQYDEDEIVCPTGPIDPQVGVLHLKNESNQTIAVLMNYSCHAVGCKQETIDGNYPGLASQYVEEMLGGVCLFTAGASGNIHPTQLWRIANKHRQQIALRRMGRELGKEIVKVVDNLNTYRADAFVKSVKQEIALPIKTIQAHESKDISNTMSRTKFTEWHRKYIYDGFKLFKRMLDKNSKKKISSILQIISIGDFTLVGIPGEPFVEYGIEVKKRSTRPHTFIVSLANDWIGYLPTETAYKLGGYQTWPIFPSMLAGEGSGRILIEKSIDLIKKQGLF